MAYELWCGEMISVKCSFCGRKEIDTYVKYRSGVICKECEEVLLHQKSSNKKK